MKTFSETILEILDEWNIKVRNFTTNFQNKKAQKKVDKVIKKDLKNKNI